MILIMLFCCNLHLAKYCEPAASKEKEYFCLAACCEVFATCASALLNAQLMMGTCLIAHACQNAFLI